MLLDHLPSSHRGFARRMYSTFSFFDIQIVLITIILASPNNISRSSMYRSSLLTARQ